MHRCRRNAAARWVQKWSLACIFVHAACGAAPFAGVHADPAVAYGPNPKQTVTVMRPADSAGSLPGVLLIHGGGWVEGDSQSMNELWAAPIVREGFVVANVDYRLATDAPAPAAILDVRTAAAWFCREAQRLGADAKRLAFVGTSAGAHLALMAALPPADDPHLGQSCRPSAVVNLWGITDMTDVLEGANARDFTIRWVAPADRQPDSLARWSPLSWATGAAPPVLTIHALHDPIVPFEHAKLLAQKLGPRAELIAVDRSWHAPVPADYPAVLKQTVDFLKRTLR